MPLASGAPVSSNQDLAGVITLPMKRGVDLRSYYAEFEVGTPPQKEYLLIDTGSPTFSFEDANGSYCKGTGKPCAHYGSFNNLTSS
jgi:candidapepsin